MMTTQKCRPHGRLLLLSALALTSTTLTLQAQNPLTLRLNENTVSILNADHPLLRYRYENVPFKPYLKELYTPAGLNILRDAPHDHLHHHALMFAIAVDGVNFWEEQNAPGRQQHIALNNLVIPKIENQFSAAFAETLAWKNPKNGDLLLVETRQIEARLLPDEKVTLLSWQSTFTLPPGKDRATLSGSHYFGLGVRFLTSMDGTGSFLNAAEAEAKIVRGTEQLLRADWCAYSAPANSKPVTLALFDHPDNPRHPATFFTMTKPFSYLAATLNLSEKPLVHRRPLPLTLRYGIALWDGPREKTAIDQLYRRWTSLPRPVRPVMTMPPKK